MWEHAAMALYERLTALDASFLGIEDPSTQMHVAAVLLFEGSTLQKDTGGLDIDRIRAFINSRLDELPRYRQRLAWIPIENHPVWVDDSHFNIQYHVRHAGLPQPGDERQLKRLAGRIMSQKLDAGKPLWEMWFVEGLGDDRFALITKAHHCMIDGVGGLDVLSALLQAEPVERTDEPSRWYPRPLPTATELLSGELQRRASLPFTLVRETLGAVVHVRRTVASVSEASQAVGEALGAGLRPASATPLNPDHIGPHRRFDTLTLDLARAKAVTERLGGTVNDVVVAVITGAVRRFLLERGVPVANLRFRALLPVNLRTEEQHGRMGNRLGMMIANLPIAETDPIERLRRVQAATQALEHSRQIRGTELLEEWGDWTPSGLFTRMLRLAAQVRTFNLVITNLPGPRVPLYLLSARLLAPYPMVPLYSNQALGIGLFSYQDTLYCGLNSDWDRLPDLHDLTEGLARSFEELAKAADVRAPA
jgi:WS/DGAT/MGAT family acyltransferase